MVDVSAAIIVTCYNQERFIRQALDSIEWQTVAADQIIIIDGFSRDRSVHVINEWLAEFGDDRYTFIAHDKNYGLCFTLNQAMELVTADYVATLYGDDWLEPDRLERQVPLLASAPDTTCMAIGSMREVNHRGIPIVDHDFTGRIAPLLAMDRAHRVESLVAENVIPSPGVLLRANAVREVGGYDEALTFDDYDMWMRLLMKYDLVFESAIVVNYRILSNSLSRSSERYGDFLLSEARMIFKQRHVTSTVGPVVARRLKHTAVKLLQRSDRDRLRVVLAMLAEVEPTRRNQLALVMSRLPGGLPFLRRTKIVEPHDH